LSGLRVVEEVLAVHAIRPPLKNRMAQNILGRAVLVGPQKGDLCPVHVLESLGGDRTPVRAPHAELRRVSPEIGFHYGLLPVRRRARALRTVIPALVGKLP